MESPQDDVESRGNRLDLTSELLNELDRRLQDIDKNPGKGSSGEEVYGAARERHGYERGRRMSWQYKVVFWEDLVPSPPSVWQLPSSHRRQWATAIEASLNKMATDGWEYVGTFVPNEFLSYVIFRRPISIDSDEVRRGQDTAIKELD
jgi:putative addiction module component (TIGR02574 family)